jgi:hypothetical protein
LGLGVPPDLQFSLQLLESTTNSTLAISFANWVPLNEKLWLGNIEKSLTLAVVFI